MSTVVKDNDVIVIGSSWSCFVVVDVVEVSENGSVESSEAGGSGVGGSGVGGSGLGGVGS
jgi:uncharacterized membrane protein